jgi:hypothetical protein
MYQWHFGNAAAVSVKKGVVNHKNVKNAGKKGSLQKLNKAASIR